jgi:hypothetical protein
MDCVLIRISSKTVIIAHAAGLTAAAVAAAIAASSCDEAGKLQALHGCLTIV